MLHPPTHPPNNNNEKQRGGFHQLLTDVPVRPRRPRRPRPQGHAALETLRSWGRAGRASVHELDVTCPASLRNFRETCINDHLKGKVDVLFNNAGVCLAGSDRVVLEHTLGVNFYGALRVMEECLPAMVHETGCEPVIYTSSTVDAGAAGATGATATATATAATVVWVSSGDGELCFLGSKWRGLLEGADSLEVWRIYDRRICIDDSQISLL